mmetsp:Transcript_6424/g.17960  ORF Transcript_6424/g.17960 Transcript_6424/m.17960 type:complete len:248 (-) Transcript_6424:1099-1842(-)
MASFACATGMTLTANQDILPRGQEPAASAVKPPVKTACTYDIGESTNIKWHESRVTREDKQKLLNQRGCVLWFTGLSGSGKSTVACTLEHTLHSHGKFTVNLDGDNVRHGLNKNLGFSPEDREENIRRIAELSKLFSQSGTITLVSFISPYRTDRDKARALMAEGDFIEIFMDIPIDVCEERDPKGLYKKARAGEIKGFTGIDDPYEPPESPEIRLSAVDSNGNCRSPESMAAEVFQYLQDRGYLSS